MPTPYVFPPPRDAELLGGPPPLYDLRYDQLYSRLLQVLSALPDIIKSRRDTVGDVAEYLCSIYWSPPDDFAPDITKQDERDLQALWKRVNALRLHINFKMSKNARVAMKIDNACQHQLVRMEETAERILERLGAHHPGRPRKRRARGSIDETVIGEGMSVRPGCLTGAKAQDGSPENLRGRPRKRRADKITAAAARGFWWLTGRHPTLGTNSEGVAYGPFLDFLKAMFEACRITASAEARAKAVRRKLRPPSI
jgi:hypothetical protein